MRVCYEKMAYSEFTIKYNIKGNLIMGIKKIVVNECIFYDLIYGKLKGPVISDAPKDIEIVGVYSELTT